MMRRLAIIMLCALAAAIIAGLVVRYARNCEPGDTGTYIANALPLAGCPVRP